MNTESAARATFQILANKPLSKLPGANVINPVAGYKSPNLDIVLDTVEIRVCSATGGGCRWWAGGGRRLCFLARVAGPASESMKRRLKPITQSWRAVCCRARNLDAGNCCR